MTAKFELKQLVANYNSVNCPVPQISIKLVELKNGISTQLAEKSILQPGPTPTLAVKNFEFELVVSHTLDKLLHSTAKGVIQSSNKVLVDLEITSNGVQTKSMSFNQSPASIQIISKDQFTYVNTDQTEVALTYNKAEKCIDLNKNQVYFALRSQLKTSVPKIKIRSLIEDHLKNSPDVLNYLKNNSNHIQL